jgi:hypothetical protein
VPSVHVTAGSTAGPGSCPPWAPSGTSRIHQRDLQSLALLQELRDREDLDLRHLLTPRRLVEPGRRRVRAHLPGRLGEREEQPDPRLLAVDRRDQVLDHADADVPVKLVLAARGEVPRRREVLGRAVYLERGPREGVLQTLLDQRDREMGDIDPDPLPLQVLRGVDGGAAAAEWIEDDAVET